jgi:hypothetical protein
MDVLGYLKMFGEVVTPEVRDAATNVLATAEVVHGTPVTTYRFDVPWMTLLGTALPTGAVLMKDELLEVHVTLSVDADGLLRVYDQQYDEQAWIDAAAAAPEDFDWFVHTRTEVVSTSDEPSTLVPPSSFVDAPAG